MASASLYPPIVDSYTPAFIASEEAKCTVNFSLFKFSSSTMYLIQIPQKEKQEDLDKQEF